MNMETLFRRIVLPCLAATILCAANPLLAQADSPAPTERLAIPGNSCPAPLDMTLHAGSPNVFAGDFTSGMLANSVGLNNSAPDKHFVYTFQWKPPHRCCQMTRAVLTINMQANQGGTSTNSSDAGNDNISIVHLGATVPPYNERIYTGLWPFQTGKQVTKVWNLTGTALANMNANNRLSLYEEDDTMVKSVTLQLSGCCLSN